MRHRGVHLLYATDVICMKSILYYERTLPTMTGQVISPSAAMTTIADVTDAIHTTAKNNVALKTALVTSAA